MQDELLAADHALKRQRHIGAAHDVHFRAGRVKVPAQLQNVAKPLSVIRVHMREKDRVELLDRHAQLRQPHVRSTASVELHPHLIAVVAVIAVLQQSPGPGQPIERRRPPA